MKQGKKYTVIREMPGCDIGDDLEVGSFGILSNKTKNTAFTMSGDWMNLSVEEGYVKITPLIYLETFYVRSNGEIVGPNLVNIENLGKKNQERQRFGNLFYSRRQAEVAKAAMAIFFDRVNKMVSK